MKADPLTRYEQTLARMHKPSTQYDDQVKRIRAFRQNGHIAMGGK